MEHDCVQLGHILCLLNHQIMSFVLVVGEVAKCGDEHSNDNANAPLDHALHAIDLAAFFGFRIIEMTIFMFHKLRSVEC